MTEKLQSLSILKRPLFDPSMRRIRFLLYLLMISIMVLYLKNRIFIPTMVIATEHFQVESCAIERETLEMTAALEQLYGAYWQFFEGNIPLEKHHTTLKARIYFDDQHFYRGSPIPPGWAEAYYFLGKSHAYYDGPASGAPCHWFIHENAHQLNFKVAQTNNPLWLEEGIATYFSCNKIKDGKIQLGQPDRATYPIWHVSPYVVSGDLEKDLKLGHFISLKSIITNQNGPDINYHFNKYYTQWWSLVHFLIHYEKGKYQPGFFNLIKDGGNLAAFKKHIGPIKKIEKEWYRYFRGAQVDLCWNSDEETKIAKGETK